MRLVVSVVLLVALAAGLGMLARYNQGYVLITYPPWRVELSLNLLIVLLLAGFVLSHLLLRLAGATLGLPEKVRAYRVRRARNRARSSLQQALTAFFEGRYGAAEKAAASTLEQDEWPALAAVIAARAAHELRAYDRRDEYLARADQAGAEGRLLRPITQAELLLREQRVSEALAALKEVRRVAPKSVAALRLELKAQMLGKNWEQALELVSRLEKVGGIGAAFAEQVRLNAYLGLVQQKSPDAAALSALWKSIPAAFRVKPSLALTAAGAFRALDCRLEAAAVIEAALEQQWDSALAELYGECAGDDAVPLIERAERWLESHPRDGRLLLALGRLCARQQLWGKARSYLEASLAIEPSHAAHLALAELFEHLGQHDEALRQYRESLARERRGSAQGQLA